MNRKQKICLLVGIAVIVVMGLFPPWVLETEKRNFLGGSGGNQRYEQKLSLEAGPYSWIGNPPSRPKAAGATAFADRNDLAATAKFIDLYRLSVQYFVVVAVTAGLIIILKDRKTG